MSETRHCVVDARRRRAPGRETEKPAPGVNSRTEDRLSGYQKIRVQRRKASCGVIRTAGYQGVGYQDSRVSGKRTEDGCQKAEDRVQKKEGKNKRAGSFLSCQPIGQM